MKSFLASLLILPSLALADAPIDATHRIRVGLPTSGLVSGPNRVMIPPTAISSGANAGIRQTGGFGWLGDFVSTSAVNITQSLGPLLSTYFIYAPNHVSYFGIYKSTNSTGDRIIITAGNNAILYTGIGLSTGVFDQGSFNRGPTQDMAAKIIGFSQGLLNGLNVDREFTLTPTTMTTLSILPSTGTAAQGGATLILIASGSVFSNGGLVISSMTQTLPNGFGGWVEEIPSFAMSSVSYTIVAHYNGIPLSSGPVNISGAQLGDDFLISIENRNLIFKDNSVNNFSRGDIRKMNKNPSTDTVIVASLPYKNRVFVLTRNGRLEWSNALDVSSFPAVNFQNVKDTSGSRPLALLQYGKSTNALTQGFIAVINERSIILINGEDFDPAIPDWTVTEIPLPPNMRLVSNGANVVRNNFIYCLSKRGIVLFDGNGFTEPYGKSLSGLFENSLGQGLVAASEDVAGGSRRHSMVSSAGGVFGSVTVMTDGTTNFTTIDFTIDNENRFWRRGNPNNTNTVNQFHTPLVVQDDRLVALTQDATNFYLMQWSNDPTIGRTTGTDFPFIATFAPVPADDLASSKHFFYVIPVFSTEGSSVTFAYRVDDGAFTNTTIFPPSGVGLVKRQRIDIGEVGSSIEFKIEQAAVGTRFTDRNFRFYYADLFYKLLEPTGGQ